MENARRIVHLAVLLVVVLALVVTYTITLLLPVGFVTNHPFLFFPLGALIFFLWVVASVIALRWCQWIVV